MSLYTGWVIEHGKQPHNSGVLEDPTHQARADNPFCGDRITVSLQVEDGVVTRAMAHARACAICIAAGSQLTELLPGRPLASLPALVEAARRAVRPDSTDVPPELLHLEDLRQVPTRTKCATLPYEALLQAIS